VITVQHSDPGSVLSSRGLFFQRAALLRPVVLVATAIAAALYQPAPVVGDLLWVIALVIIGMPHGAFDVAVVLDQLRSQGRRPAIVTAAIYTALTAAAAVCFILAPVTAVVLFLLMAAHHFGVSDCVWTRGRGIRSASDHLVGLSHGVAVLVVPFISAPDAAWGPFVAIANAAGGGMHVDPSLTRSVAAALWVVALLVQISVWGARRRDARGIEQFGVLAGATLLGLTAPPLLAIGVYFLVVHALGHCLRADAQFRRALLPGLANALRVHRRSAPLWIPSVGIVVVIAASAFGDISVSSIALAFLLFCVVGTLPHHLLWLGVFGPLGLEPEARTTPESL